MAGGTHAYISGVSGSVARATGYVTDVSAWEANLEVSLYETTAWPNTGATTTSGVGENLPLRTRSVGIKSASGNYECKQVTSNTSGILLLGYDYHIIRLSNTVKTDVLEGTRMASTNVALGDDWKRMDTNALFDIDGEAEVLMSIDDALPLPGTLNTLTIVVGNGMTLTFTATIAATPGKVSRDGTQRSVTMRWVNSGATMIAVGGYPLPGSALETVTFTADSQTPVGWVGSVVDNSVKLDLAADRVSGKWTIGWDGSLEFTSLGGATTTAGA